MAADESQIQVKVTVGEGEGQCHGGVVSEENGDERDARCRLAMTSQELAAVKRHLADSRRENDDLLKAVAYLRSKLDTTTSAVDDTPTDLHIHDNNDVTAPIKLHTAVSSSSDDDSHDYEDDDDVERYDDGLLLQQRSSAELNSYNSNAY